MIYLCYALFALGLVAYGVAIFNIGNNTGETASDIGNAAMLLTAVLLLFRAARWGRRSDR
jgi:hypothetical protein